MNDKLVQWAVDNPADWFVITRLCPLLKKVVPIDKQGGPSGPPIVKTGVPPLQPGDKFQSRLQLGLPVLSNCQVCGKKLHLKNVIGLCKEHGSRKPMLDFYAEHGICPTCRRMRPAEEIAAYPRRECPTCAAMNHKRWEKRKEALDLERKVRSESGLIEPLVVRPRGRDGGRHRLLSSVQIKEATKLLQDRTRPILDICKKFHVGRATLYSACKGKFISRGPGGGRPRKLSNAQIKQVVELMRDRTISIAAICRKFDISRSVAYSCFHGEGAYKDRDRVLSEKSKKSTAVPSKVQREVEQKRALRKAAREERKKAKKVKKK